MWRSWLFAFQRKKLNFFFKNRKSTSTWLRWINCYYESKVHTLKMFLSYYHDIQYSKHFPSFFWLQNENYIYNSLIKTAQKYFFKFWMWPIIISCYKYALGLGFSSPIMLGQSESWRGRFLIFEKKFNFCLWNAKS